MFVNIIFMFTVQFFILHYLLLGSNPYWGSLLHILPDLCFQCLPLIELDSQKCIDIYLFELFFMCIKTHIFVPSFSISHLFVYIINVFYCFLLLGKLLTLNIQHYKTCNQHHIYTIVEEIPSF